MLMQFNSSYLPLPYQHLLVYQRIIKTQLANETTHNFLGGLGETLLVVVG
jgi:hypothetical protein